MREDDDVRPQIAIVHFPCALPSKIYQRDLKEFLELTEKLRKAEAEWDRKREYIKRALSGGAQIENGMHEAYLSHLVVR